MSFTATQIQFLQRLVSERPSQRRGGEIANFFFEHYSVGTMVGRNIEYRDADHKRAESLLRTHDLPVQPLKSDATRADVARYGGLSEKNFSEAPHARSVAVKFIGGCSLNGQSLATPSGTYMVLYPESAMQVTCDRLLLVENLETFRRLEDYKWVRYDALSVMAIFRGDPSLSISDALEVVRRRPEAIWAFVDFDPAGLAIANSLPQGRLERVVLPAATWLEKAADTHRGRQLYADQAGRYTASLDSSIHAQVCLWWREMKHLQSAVTQERMLSANQCLSNEQSR